MKIVDRARLSKSLLALAVVLASAVSVMGMPAATAAPTHPAAPTDQWLQTNGDGAQNRTNPAQSFTLAQVPTLQAKWTALGGGIGTGGGGAVIAAGRAYFASTRGSGWETVEVVNAVRVSDGHRLWATTVPKPKSEATKNMNRFMALRGSMLYVADTVINDSARVTALNIKTHKVVWAATASPAPKYFSTFDAADFVVDGGQVYLESEYGMVDAFDRLSGRRLWHARLEDGPQRGALVAADGVLFDAKARTGGVLALNGRTGRPIWSLRGAGGLVTVAAGRVLIVAPDQRFAVPLRPCASGSTCAVRSWHKTDTDRCRFDPNDYRNMVSLSAADAHNVVFAERCDDRAYLQDIDATTGAVKWTRVLPSGDIGVVARSGSLLYFQLQGRLRATPLACAARCPLPTVGPSISGSEEIAIAQGTLIARQFLDHRGDGLIALRLPTS